MVVGCRCEAGCGGRDGAADGGPADEVGWEQGKILGAQGWRSSALMHVHWGGRRRGWPPARLRGLRLHIPVGPICPREPPGGVLQLLLLADSG